MNFENPKACPGVDSKNDFGKPNFREMGLFEAIASRTWKDMRDGYKFKVSQGEESMTDRILLDIVRAIESENFDLQVLKIDKKTEAKCGFDFELWIGNQGRWLRYILQAKRLNVATRKYDQLNHKVKRDTEKIPQIVIFEDFAKRHPDSIPLYCFYNYLSIPSVPRWNCGLAKEYEQFGCSIVPLQHVKRCNTRKGGKDFKSVHDCEDAFPWRCLMCRRFREDFSKHPLVEQAQTGRLIHEELPYFLQGISESSTTESKRQGVFPFDALPRELYFSDLGGYPKRIAKITIE
jgi:hypothetical protein